MKVIDRIKQSYSESLLKEYIDIYVKYRIPNIAAAETYYLTLTFFPLIIVLYTLLGTRYSFLIRLLNNAKNVMTEDTYETVAAFLGYVARNTNDTMFIAAVVVLITSAAAAFRSVHVTIGKMQGMIRFRGVFGFFLSFPLAVVFVAMIYIAVFLILSGRGVLNQLQKYLPFVSMTTFWNYGRIFLLIGIIFLLIYFIYDISIPKKAKYDIKPGTLVTTMLLFIISFLFGTYIDRFSGYPLVYGSLASIILLMLWLYLCAYSVLTGAVLNIVLHFHSQREEVLKAEEALFDEEFPMTEYQRIVEDDISDSGGEYYDEY